MLETMTYVGIDVHARSVHAAAIDVGSGELRRARFGGGSDQVVEWLQTLPLPLKGCGLACLSGYRSESIATGRYWLRPLGSTNAPRSHGCLANAFPRTELASVQ